jgi:hypothetical protein
MSDCSNCPESTIESANRRNFIKKAVLVTAASGTAALGRNFVIPESSASSAANVSACNVYARDCVFVDTNGSNNGLKLEPGLRFGCSGSGEGIASNRTAACCGPGLDFYTDNKLRMSIYKSGGVNVSGSVSASSVSAERFSGSCLTHRPKTAVISARSLYGLVITGTSWEDLSCCSAPCSGKGTGVQGSSVFGTGVLGCSYHTWCCGTACCGVGGCGTGVRGSSVTGTGVHGCSHLCYCSHHDPVPFGGSGIGVLGSSVSGIAIKGTSCGPVTGSFSNNGKAKDKTAGIQIQNGCSTPVAWNAGVGGAGDGHGVTNGQFFFGHCGPKMVLAPCGKVGIGTIAPNATLQVNGGISVGTRILTNSYMMTNSDFAILANASSKAITITLPPASNTGQVVHVKKIDASTHAVMVARSGKDTIEGTGSKSLSSQYQSLMLIAGGDGVWYILSSAT